MRATIGMLALALGVAGATGAAAMTHINASPAFAGRAMAVDPDERLSRLAGASAPRDASRAKPARSARTILKDDPYLRQAFAGLDNR